MDSRLKIMALGQVLLTLLWLALFSSPLQAAVHACPTADGNTVYQDRPCDRLPAKTSNTAPTAETSKPRVVGEYPFKMHGSWFLPPLHAPQPAYCDRLGCDCATQTRNFRNGLAAAVADALFLETAWHRYAEQVIQMETNPPTGLAYLELQVAIEESACDIQMSQLTVKNYVEIAVKELKIRADAAKRRGNTRFEQCDGTDERVCADVDAYALFERVEKDIETLTLPRYFLIADAE